MYLNRERKRSKRKQVIFFLSLFKQLQTNCAYQPAKDFYKCSLTVLEQRAQKLAVGTISLASEKIYSKDRKPVQICLRQFCTSACRHFLSIQCSSLSSYSDPSFSQNRLINYAKNLQTHEYQFSTRAYYATN